MSALAAALAGVRLLVLDVDGVLTDGRLYFAADGDEYKTFHVLDGHGIRLLQQAGIAVAIVSGRRSPALRARARGLDVSELHEGVADKVVAVRAILARLGLDAGQSACIGDDSVDLPLFGICAVRFAVPAAPPAVKLAADYVTGAPGGAGAVREVCELLLHARGGGGVA